MKSLFKAVLLATLTGMGGFACSDEQSPEEVIDAHYAEAFGDGDPNKAIE